MKKIIAKAAFDKAQMEHKLYLGCDGIEVQMSSEFLQEDGSIVSDLNSIVDIREFLKYPITGVHIPCHSTETLLIEHLTNEDKFNQLIRLCKFVNKLGELKGHRILVVMHTELDYEIIRQMGLLDSLSNKISILLESFDYVEFGIENTMLISVIDNTLYSKNAFDLSAVKLARYIRNELNTDRVGTVLDTCHAMSAINVQKLLKFYFNMVNVKFNNDFTLKDFFRENAYVCKEIHLAGLKLYGVRNENHGTAITVEDSDLMAKVLAYYESFNFTCPICIEVQDEDYLDCTNYKVTYDLLKSLDK